MIQDPTAKLLYEFLQMTGTPSPQLFCIHLAIRRVKASDRPV